VAALPVVVLLGSIALFRIRIHFSALIGLAVALGIAVFVYGMPARVAGATTIFGAAYGLFPIGWIIPEPDFPLSINRKKGPFHSAAQQLGHAGARSAHSSYLDRLFPRVPFLKGRRVSARRSPSPPPF
jgi:lactate permease